MCRPPAASLIICLWLVGRSQGNGSFQASAAELHARFAVSLFQTLAGPENGSNLVVSPWSVSASLGLLQLGARANTLAQLEGTLGYNAKDAQVQTLLPPPHGATWDRGKGLQQTCTLLLQSGVRLAAEFARQATAWANASVIRANLSQAKRSPEQAGSSRDEWWHLQAGGSSGELSGSGEAQVEAPRWDQRLQMALVDTVAFRGLWQKQFQFTSTQNLPFALPEGGAIKVPMMYQATEVGFGQFRTAAEQRYTVLELPFLGRTLSLQVVLPSERKAPLASLEAQLTAGQVASWESGLRRTKMDVFLPRFKIQNKFNLRSVLPAMGISDAFNPTTADFSGISAEEKLYVSDAFHDARIEVTEDGTKAAAATSMVFLKRSRAPLFKADRPFLFLLRHTSTGSVLFLGRVTNPGAPGP